MKAGSSARSTLHSDLAPMKFDYGLDKIQTQASADDSGGIAAAVVALKEPSSIGLRNAHAPILNRNDR